MQHRTHRIHAVGPRGRGVHRLIADALRAALPGDTVVVAPGRYEESLELPRRVVLVAEQGTGTVLLAAPPGGGPALTVQGPDCLVRSLDIEGADPGEPAVTVAPGAGLVLAHCTVRGGRIEVRGPTAPSRGSGTPTVRTAPRPCCCGTAGCTAPGSPPCACRAAPGSAPSPP